MRHRLLLRDNMDAFDLRHWPEFILAGGDASAPAIIDQVAIDSRRIDSKYSLFVPLPGEHCDGHQFIEDAVQRGTAYALVGRDWRPSIAMPENFKLLHVDNPLHAFQDIAQAYRKQLPTVIVVIGGSYGKTMVKDLLQAMIATSKEVAASPESFNSQIGAALSLFTITKKHDIALIEAAISRRQEMDRLVHMIVPDHAIITHIGKKHLATLGDLQTIAAEFMKLPLALSKENWAILPNSPLIGAYRSRLQAKPYFWSAQSAELPHAAVLNAEHSARMPYRIDFPDGTTYANQATFGFYYFLDLLNITIKAAWLLGIGSDAIRTTLANYTAEPMRAEIWRSPIGATFINDTYCSDPQSVDRALKHLEQTPRGGRRIFVFGGMRGQQRHADNDYRRIGHSINKAKIDLLLLVGAHKFDSLIAEVQKQSPGMEISTCAAHQEAIDKMHSWVRQDDVILIKGEKKEPLNVFMEAFNDSICNNQCLINLAAIEANITTIRHKLPSKTRIMVMVKALAYGTNDIRMGKFLSTCGIDIFGVSYCDEGVALKRAGITQAIFVINAAVYEAAKIVKWDLEVGVSEKELITAIAYEASRQSKKIKVHLHLDTGMSRFGCRPEEVLELARYIKTLPSLILEGVMTHFACADDPAGDEFTLSQARHFDHALALLHEAGIAVPWKHAANSSAVMRFDFPHYNMARIGLAAYGLYPSEATKHTLDLRLALSLVSRIVGVNTCRAGETISYGRTYKVSRDQQRIAVIPIGYFDGLHRNYSGKGSVIIRGQKAPMVGKICMDFMMVDLTDIPNAAIGDSVLIFGEDEHGHYLSPEELAVSGDSIVYELITCLGPRIQRIFIYEEAYQLR